MKHTYLLLSILLLPFAGMAQKARKQPAQTPLDKLKTEAVAAVEGQKDQAQQINDMLFSFSELDFQEVETFTYLTTLLR